MASLALAPQTKQLRLTNVGTFARMRGLAWSGNALYASRGYELFRGEVSERTSFCWKKIADYSAPLRRHLTSRLRLSSRLMRDGFHALAVLPSGHVVAAVPNAVITLAPGETEFRITHRVLRGTRPLHFASAPNGNAFWGEYFNNRDRDEVYIYGSVDHGENWEIANVFSRGEIRHVHNIVYDGWGQCFWILTGDEADECKIIRATLDFKKFDTILCSGQQTRAAAFIPAKDALYFSSDSPHEQNHIYRLDRRGHLTSVAPLASSSIYGCRVGDALFFSCMAEPSAVNVQQSITVYSSPDGYEWAEQLKWNKDRWPMRYFQYGNAFLPDGENTTAILAVSTVAVSGGDGDLSLYRVQLS